MTRAARAPDERHDASPDRAAGGTRPASLYVHVPFCVVKCGYCDFNSYVVPDEAVHDRFLDALAAELRLAALPARPVSVFLGGGTPSLLSPTRLHRLLDLLSRHFDLQRCPEVTMEANPESITREKAEIARASGVDRVSMGVQSFDPEALRFLDRAHSGERAIAAFAELRAAGFDNVSLDMIFGTPGQTLAQWRHDLDTALGLGPDHLSCYNLIYEPGTRLRRDLDRGRVARNDEELDREMFLWTRQVLEAAGYHAYEISNFAGRGGPCRHNDHYWLQGDYLGVGPGASSHRRGVRWTNLKPIEAWAESALAGLPPVASAETLTPAQRAGEALWLGLRRTAGLDLAAVTRALDYPVAQRFGTQIDQHVRRGWLERWSAGSDAGAFGVRLTAEGILMADAVGAAYLEPAS